MFSNEPFVLLIIAVKKKKKGISQAHMYVYIWELKKKPKPVSDVKMWLGICKHFRIPETLEEEYQLTAKQQLP